MVKKSKKSKSKRITLRQKYKVIKKVKQHHKKKAKQAKRLGLHRKQKIEKDPGIPNHWPFKEQELKALEARRARAIDEIEQKKSARKQRAKQIEEGLVHNSTIKEKNIVTHDDSDEEIDTKISENRSDRVFYKEMVKVIEESDVVLEVLDARDPLGTRCVDVEKMVVRHGTYKHLVLLLNKIDLVPKESVEKWLNYLREELPAVAFKCNTQEQRSNLGWRRSSKSSKSSKSVNIRQSSSDCLGAETLLKLLKNYSRSHEIKKSITVGVIGLPNVGKSSLINSLKRCRAVSVGATPGLTRSMQEVHLDKNVRLLDCPGVVMPGYGCGGGDGTATALRNCKRIEKMEDVVGPVKEILRLCPERRLVLLYKIAAFVSVDDFLRKVAAVRGKLKKGGAFDSEGAARIVIRDWNEGRIPYHTMPPTRERRALSTAEVVPEFSKEFDIDEVYGGESSFIGSLKSLDDFYNLEIPPNPPFESVEIEGEAEKTVEMAETLSESEEEEDDDDDEDVMMDNDNKVEVKGRRSEQGKENEELYEAEGIVKPGRVRAEKKRRKKAKKLLAEKGKIEDTSSMDTQDYDFRVDYNK